MTLVLQVVATVAVVWLAYLAVVSVVEDALENELAPRVLLYVCLPLVLVLLAIWRAW